MKYLAEFYFSKFGQRKLYNNCELHYIADAYVSKILKTKLAVIINIPILEKSATAHIAPVFSIHFN